jgi:hypothetical protein
MFRTSLCPSSGEHVQDWLKLHVKMPGCAGCGCAAYTTAPHNHSQHNQASSHEVLASLVLVLLMMGIKHVEIDLIQEII